ncbi:AAA family ATPase [Oceanospirillum sanctuarii]|uniref:AAA family ATPase n=1 Tax=Oceanospirillum sanctuarii TaxID=1434821 RepID=UPI001593DA3B|nr:ATP-binding protein [Oceanospirillum sanctuarii]
MMKQGRLYFFCGKMGAGKSTYSKQLAAEKQAVRLSEDEWLAAHYPDQIRSFDDYLKHAALICPFVRQLVQQVLATGTDVVMDFPANTLRQRSWFLNLCRDAGCEHQMIWLDLSDEECLKQIAKRRLEQPERAAFDTETVFHQVTAFFEPPTAEEGLNLMTLTSTANSDE